MRNDAIYAKGIFAIVMIAILTSYPYVFFLFLPIPSFLVMMVFTFCALLGWSLLNKPKLEPLPKNFTVIFIIQILVWLFYIFIHRDITYFTRITYMIVAYLALLTLNNVRNGLFDFFSINNKWITLMAIGGTLAFFVILFTGWQPLFQFKEFDNRTGYFFGLTTTNAYLGNIIRYSGFFDEPGQMAFWGVWAIIFNFLFFKSKKVEMILTICLVFTFSMAYYIQLLFYIIFFKIRDIKKLFFLLIVLCSVGGWIYTTKDSDWDLYALTFKRFETNDSGKLKGDNRSNLAEIAWNVFVQNPIFGVGAQQAVENMEYMSDNPYTLLAFDGIVGAINTYLPLIFITSINYKRKNFIKAVFILALGYLQRPFGVFFIYPFFLYALVILTYLKYNSTKRLNGKNYCSDSMLQCCKID